MKRRDFLQKLALATGTVGFSISGVPMRSFANPLMRSQESKNRLVFIQLAGGNDALNTLVPFDNDIYYKSRPVLAIPKNDVLKFTSTLGFNKNLAGFEKLYNDGLMSIIQNVGYENPERSHFKAIDIWNSASDSETVRENGWMSRYLSALPEALETSRPYPMAVELGWSGSLLVEEPTHTHSLYMNSLDEYLTITKDFIDPIETDGMTLADKEFRFLNYIAIQSNRYAGKISQIANKGRNIAEYPKTSLGKQLAIIAKLMSGGLETSVYLAKLNGFDTHIIQAEPHAMLLDELSQAMLAFQTDLQALGLADNVTTLVYTEFGRRVEEGGLGTDHGAATPLFVIGNTVKPGIIGVDPNLGDLDSNGDIKYKFDYRQVYSTILKDHMYTSEARTLDILGREYPTLPIFKNSVESLSEGLFNFESLYPNPTSSTTTIKFATSEVARISVDLYSVNGQKVSNLMHRQLFAGTYQFPIDLSGVPAGSYRMLLTVNGRYLSKQLVKL